MTLNYKKLYFLDFKSIFNFEDIQKDSYNDLTPYLLDISEGINKDKGFIIKEIKSMKNVKTKLDFIYKHIYDVEDLKLQFTKKMKMKNRVVDYKKYIIDNPKSKNNELVNKILLRFKFNILQINSLEFGFYILAQIKIIINDLLVFLKQTSKKILDTIYHQDKINFDAEILILFIKGLVRLKIAKDQNGKDLKSSKLIKILMKTFLLIVPIQETDKKKKYISKKPIGSEYTEKTLIKKLSHDYILKKNIDDLNEFKEIVQKSINEISKTTYFKAIQERLRKKIQK